MQKRISIMITSIIFAFSMITIGYGFWTDHLDIEGNAAVHISLSVVDDIAEESSSTEGGIIVPANQDNLNDSTSDHSTIPKQETLPEPVADREPKPETNPDSSSDNTSKPEPAPDNTSEPETSAEPEKPTTPDTTANQNETNTTQEAPATVEN